MPSKTQNNVCKVLVVLLMPCVFAQENEYFTMKALGRPAHLGFLYDARKETFFDFSVFKESLPATFVKTLETPFSHVKTSMTNTYQQKFNLFDISASLSASVLSGMLTIKGSAQFLKSKQQNTKDVTGALLLDCKTVTESLELYYTDLKNLFNTELIAQTEATHVVTGISWGANVVVIFKDTVTDKKDETKIAGSLEIEFKKLEGPFQISGSASVDIHGKESNETSTFALSVQGDIPVEVPTSHEEVADLIKKVPELIRTTNDGKGVPVEFRLTPIGRLKSHLESTSKQNNFATKIEDTILNNFITKFDEMLVVEKLVNDNYELFTQNKVCVMPDTLEKMYKLQSQFVTAKLAFTTSFQAMLTQVRSSEADSTELLELIELYESNEFSATNVAISLGDFQDARNKVDMYKVIVNSNRRIQYFGATNNLEAALVANANKVMYILFFKSEWIESDVTAWENTIHTFLHVLNKPHNTLLVADCDFRIRKCTGLNRTVITQVVNGKTVLKDVDAATRIKAVNLKLIVQGLGTRAQVGELYDARTDTFLGNSILKSTHSNSLIQSTTQNTTHTVAVPSETIQDKFVAFQIQEEQQLGILASSLPRFCSGNYLATSTKTRSKHVYRQSILQTTRTFEAQLDTELPDFTNEIAQANLFSNIATHFVTKIKYGYNAVFSIEVTCTTNDLQADDGIPLNTNHCNLKLQKLKASFFQLVSKITLSKEQNLNLKDELNFLKNSKMNFKILVYSDIQPWNSPPMTFDATDSFFQFLTSDFVPNHKAKNAPALIYHLTPISSLQEKGIIAPVVSYGSLSSNVFTPSDVISILEDTESAREQILQVSQKLHKNAYCITDQNFDLLQKIESEFKDSVGDFQKNYKNTVLEIKSGTLSMDSLEKLILKYQNYSLLDNSNTFKGLMPLFSAEQKINLCKSFNSANINYLGRESSSIYFEAIFEPKPFRASLAYLLYFKSEWLTQNSSEWPSTSQLFVGQLSKRVRTTPAIYYIVDCDFEHKSCANITRPSIFEYKNGLLTTTDYKETIEVEEETIQGQLDELRASVTENLAAVKSEVTKIKSDIEHTDAVSAKLETEVIRNRNNIGAQQTGLDAVNTTAVQNQNQIRVAARIKCEEQKTTYITKANTSSSFGCGGTIQMPSKGESIVVDFKLAPNNGFASRCFWTLDAGQNNKLVRFQVKLTLLCQHPTLFLDKNTLTFTEWNYGIDDFKQLTTSRISSSSQNSFVMSNDFKNRGFLSFNANKMDSEAGFIIRVDVLDTRVFSYFSSSTVTHKESVGSASYGPLSPTDRDYEYYGDFSSIAINPLPAAKMTLTVDVDFSSGSDPCSSQDSVDVVEFGIDGVPKQLGRLCGRNSVISYEMENPVAAMISWSSCESGECGRGVKLSWK